MQTKHSVKLVIDGQEIELDSNGDTKTYAKFKQPAKYDGDKSLIASVYIPLAVSPLANLATLAGQKS